jgi:Ca-activated chloride channel homolog
MARAITILLLCILLNNIGFGQAKSLNSCVDYANQSAEEMTAVVASLIGYYPKTFEKKSWNVPRYTCPIQQEEYYYKKALGEPGIPAAVLTALKELRAAADNVDSKCKALDTYHKLEDYKKDNYAAGQQLVSELRPLVEEYAKKQDVLSKELSKAYAKIGVAHGYVKTAELMRKQLERERMFLDRWKFNLLEEIPTGWIVEELQKSITDTDEALKAMKPMKPVLNYPASSMWPSFQEALASILETKRRALDEFNFEARKSDKHKNDVYMSLINYYNGTLLSAYNTFLQFAAQDKFTGLKAIAYVPVFEINKTTSAIAVEVTPFKDIPRAAVKVPPGGTSLTKSVVGALTNYVEYINETFRQVSHHRDVIRNLNSSASYYASLTNYVGKGGLSFTHDDFEVPLSYFQKTVTESKVLGNDNSTVLNNQAEVLLNILREIDQIGAALEVEVAEKRYQKDKVKRVYELLERTNALFNIWDERKEVLFEDVQKLFDAYKGTDVASSWYRSGHALRKLTALDHDALFKAKDFYKGKIQGPIETSVIDATLRDVLNSEYENMKGIEKYGRNNGLCPYTPYEDLPKSSRTLSELLQELKLPRENQTGYQHPYHSMVYMYNEVVDDYNKFCELSPVPLLKYIKQPELFSIIAPQDPKPETPPATSSASNNLPSSQREAQAKVEVKQESTVKEKPRPESKTVVVRDTVFIEKRDTIYLHDPSENVRSMEGYATNNMVLLLDVSGSMNAPEKLPLLKKSVLDMLSMMRAEDEISIVVFSGKPKTLLPAMSFKEEDKIKKAINALKPGGTTDGNAGLKLAYKVADENYIRGGNNRIVLATDGEFPVSNDTQELVRKFAGDDIFLTVFYFGKNANSGKNLQRIAADGKGNYEFISKENVDMKLIREVKAKRQK